MIPTTAIPFASAFFLVIVGMMIMYLLATGSRLRNRRYTSGLEQKVRHSDSERHQIQRELVELKQQYERLRGSNERQINSLREQHQQSQELRLRAEAKLENYQAKFREQSDSVQQVHRKAGQVATRFADLRAECDELNRQLQQQRLLREKADRRAVSLQRSLENEVTRKAEQNTENQSSPDRIVSDATFVLCVVALQAERHRGSILQSQLDRALSQLDAMTCKQQFRWEENYRQTEQIALLQDECHCLRQRLLDSKHTLCLTTRQMEEENDNTRRVQAHVERLQHALETQTQNVEHLSETLRIEREAAEAGRSKVESFAERIRELERIDENVKRELEAKQAALETAESANRQYAERINTLERRVEDLAKRLTTRDATLQAADQQSAHLNDALQQANVEKQKLADQFLDQRHTGERMEQQLHQANGLVEQLRAELRSIGLEKEDAKAAAARLRSENEQLRDIEQRLSELEIQVEDAEETIARLETEKASLQKSEERLRQTAAEWREELDSRTTELNQAVSENKCLQSVLQQRASQVHELSAQLRDVKEEAEKRQAELQSEHSRFQQIKQELNQLQGIVIAEQQRSEELAERLQSTDVELQQLRRGQSVTGFVAGKHVSNSIPGTSGLSFSNLQRRIRVPRQEDDSCVSTDSLWGRVYVKRPPEPDELTLLTGMTEELADQLNRLGVWTFWQLKGFERLDVGRIARELAVDQAVIRSAWIPEARRRVDSDRSAA